ncbi:MAG: zinc-binding dehydrogenase [Thermomicrobiales bacterium]
MGAKGFGRRIPVNPMDGDAVQQIKAITDGNGVNASFEAVGKPQTLETAIWCRDLASRCVVIGVADQQATMELPIAKFFDLGRSLRVSWYGDCLPTRDFPLLANWASTGQRSIWTASSRGVSPSKRPRKRSTPWNVASSKH